MARNDQLRIEVVARVIAQDPVLVGGGEGAGIDSVPFVDSLDRYVVPGTGVAGALRAALASTFSQDPVALFGDSTDTGASRIEFDDLIFTDGDDDDPIELEHRDGVAIDRSTGTAIDGAKFDRDMIAPGAQGRLRLVAHFEEYDARTWREPSRHTDPTGLMWFARAVSLLRNRGLRVGSGSSRGRGLLTFEGWQVTDFDLRTRAGILDLAARDESTDPRDETLLDRLLGLAGDLPSGPSTFTLDWEPVLPVFVARGHSGVAIDTWPLVVPRAVSSDVATGSGARRPHRAMLLLPASSIKGVLRSRAEWIVRTAAGVDAADGAAARVPLVDILFGSGGSSSSAARRGALLFRDCTADLGIDHSEWLEVEDIDRGASRGNDEGSARMERLGLIRSKLTEVFGRGTPRLVPRAFTAIDRWTGGVSGSRLYSVLEPGAIEWSPITIGLDHNLVPDEKRAGCTALLLLLFNDLTSNEIAFGGRVTRGYGSIRATGWSSERFFAEIVDARSASEESNLLETPLEVMAKDPSYVADLARAFQHVLDDWRNDVNRDRELREGEGQ